MKKGIEIYVEAEDINDVISKLREDLDKDFHKKITQIKQVWRVVYYDN